MISKRTVHAYGGRQHSTPGPFEGCLLCRVDDLKAQLDEQKALDVERLRDLEAENKRLKGCGNCGHLEWDTCDGDGMCDFSREHDHDIELFEPSQKCHFTPSKWRERT